MTTVLADSHLGIVVADSGISDGDRQWVGRKVWRIGGALVAIAGNLDECQGFLAWYRGGMEEKPPPMANASAMAMTEQGIVYFSGSAVPLVVESGREAIGSGAKAAMCAYEALGWQDPKRAVQIVCRHDARSRAPVRVYQLKKHGQTT